MSNPVSSVTTFKESPSQTAGPYMHIGFLPAHAGLNLRTQEKLNILTGEGVEGEHIRIEGMVYDGAGALVRDAVIETWQADAKGRHNQSGFFGWGRAAVDFASGEWHIETIKPGTVNWQDGRPQAPHISLILFARGINGGLQCTRAANKSMWRFVQMVRETCLFIFGAWTRLAEEWHSQPLHRVE